MTYDFHDKIKTILEAIEDEENVEVDPRGDEDIIDKQVDFKLSSGTPNDWTGIANAKPGKTLKDMISKRIKGPPMIERDGKATPADPTIMLDDEQYVRKFKLPSGRITQNVYDKLDPELQTQYTKVSGEEDYTKKPRETVEKEFIGYNEGEKWYFDDVVSALKSTIISHARNTSTPNFSVDEGVVAGIKGVLDAWMTDLGRAPFNNHAFSSIKTAVRDGAAKAGNITGKPISKGGTRRPFDASKSTVSADAPVGTGDGEEGSSFASTISGGADTGEKSAKEQISNRDLIFAMVNNDNVGLNDKERIVLLATYGINRSGDWIEGGPKNTKEIANAFGISNVRVSQMRKKAIEKIRDYIESKQLTQDTAAQEFGISNESKSYLGALIVAESIVDILNIEVDMLSEHQKIPVVIEHDGINRNAIAMVNTDTFEVDDVVYEDESVLYMVNKNILSEAKRIARSTTSSQYFSEMVSGIVKIHSQPILGIIGSNLQQDDDDNEEE